jgi:hypothetical protein
LAAVASSAERGGGLAAIASDISIRDPFVDTVPHRW